MLVHGATDRGADVADLGDVEARSADLTVIAPDVRGHGLSTEPHDPAAYSWARFAGDVAAVLDGLSIESAHLFGHSLGGRAALATAVRIPSDCGRSR